MATDIDYEGIRTALRNILSGAYPALAPKHINILKSYEEVLSSGDPNAPAWADGLPKVISAFEREFMPRVVEGYRNKEASKNQNVGQQQGDSFAIPMHGPGNVAAPQGGATSGQQRAPSTTPLYTDKKEAAVAPKVEPAAPVNPPAPPAKPVAAVMQSPPPVKPAVPSEAELKDRERKAKAAKDAAIINLKNGTVGLPYETQIEKPKEFAHTTVQPDSRFADIGLTVTSDLRVTGSPTKDGTHKLVVTFSDDKQRTEREYKLVVNPDPKSLWKKVEPAPEDKAFYDKAHTDTKFLQDERGLVLGASLRGRSHEHEAKFREDDFNFSLNSAYRFIVVSDGAGSAKYSRIGSKQICDKAHRLLTEKFASRLSVVKPILEAYKSGPLSDAQNNIISTEFYKIFTESAFETRQFLEATVVEFTAKYPDKTFTLKDFAGTLLMVICLPLPNRKTLLFSFGIGDGAIGYISQTEGKNLYKPDSGEFSGQTVFLVTPSWFADAEKLAKRMKIELVQDLSAVLVMTDGVSDPVFETENGLDNPKKWQDLWEKIKPQISAANPEEAMLKWLEFWSAGNHDDRTIVVATTGK